jgi:diadenosine tetraphosphate (Ap4A) HIT family hydrolase
MLADIEDCSLCVELAGRRSAYTERHGRRDCWRSHDLAVLPSLGPLAIGHMLVVPIPHVTSFARFAQSHPASSDVLREVIRRAEEHFGLCVAFEHGVLDTHQSSGGCGISHAHVHVVPVPRHLEFPQIQGCAFRPVETWSELLGKSERHPSYLYLRLPDGSIFGAAARRLESQTLRRWVAAELGMSEWDWRSMSDEHLPDTLHWLRTTDPPDSLSKIDLT